MTTTFDTQFLAGSWPQLQSLFGTAATRNTVAGGTASVTGIFSPGRTVPAYLPVGEQITETAVFAVSADDYPNPHLDETLVVDGRTWAVVAFGDRSPILELQLELVTQRRVGSGRRAAGGGG